MRILIFTISIFALGAATALAGSDRLEVEAVGVVAPQVDDARGRHQPRTE